MNQKASIVIVNLNQARLTLGCVASILENTKGHACEIIVVDNGSSGGEIEILGSAFAQFKLIRLDRNMFFGEASNIGAEHATGDLVVFLNNDIKVTPRWIEPLIEALETEYCAGAVGSKILHPNNELLEAGGIVRPDGWGIQVGKGGMPLPPGFVDATRITDYCSGACLLMRTKVFLDLGGFDPIFDPAYFEDVDLAIRLRAIGLFTYYCGASVVYHEESTTSNRIWSPEERRGHIAANHKRLVHRWGRYLERRLEQDLEPEPLPAISWERENSRTASDYRVVLYSSKPLKADAPSQTLLRVAAALQNCCSVVIATQETYSRCRVYSLCREFGEPLTSFSVRRMSDLEKDSRQLVVTFGGGAARGLPAPHLAFEQEGAHLVALVDRLSARGQGGA
ncbi:MAG: glycosyltransferase family 2 protein [Alphaproteobacteria bacterium]